MELEKLKKLFCKLLDDYESSEAALLHDRSTNENDWVELGRKTTKYKVEFEELVKKIELMTTGRE